MAISFNFIFSQNTLRLRDADNTRLSDTVRAVTGAFLINSFPHGCVLINNTSDTIPTFPPQRLLELQDI